MGFGVVMFVWYGVLIKKCAADEKKLKKNIRALKIIALVDLALFIFGVLSKILEQILIKQFSQ
jgi:hypothetical protein